MKKDVVELISAPSKDPEFAKKYFIALVLTALSVCIVPVVALTGYVARTIKKASFGERGLPDWTDPKGLFSVGIVALLSGVYALPGAIILSVGILTGGVASGFSLLGISLLGTFISVAGFAIFFVGLAFSMTAIYLYVHEGEFLVILNAARVIGKTREKADEMGSLFGLACVAMLVAWAVNIWMGTIGLAVSSITGAFFSLALATGVGLIYGPLDSGKDPEPPAEPTETAAEEAPLQEDAWTPDETGDDTWKPS